MSLNYQIILIQKLAQLILFDVKKLETSLINLLTH